ncbi:hypothetical protein NF324_001458 [Salmonella enterica]|nr:hypothetical protein [Salmonella enterica subsp. enterica serovar Chailey]ECH9472145.1 hypothetical protein [Salmonella enterica subsp. enterica]EGU9664109.1 hypothetical protein [Salmonella enterica]EDK8481335.1 hypothetical protein [Salmonella enterica subsp. enterica serovar Chailey]EED9685253.1 hypothetical protein [Salmonella enterica subsp. enterica]
MVTTNDLRNFVKTKCYVDLLDRVITDLNLVLNKNEPSSQIFNIYSNDVNKANVTVNELEELCSDKDKIVKFIELYFSEISDDEKDEDDDSETIEVVPFYSNFLIGYLVDYYMLKNRQDELENYLKNRRIPDYKKFANELRLIYKNI